MAEIYQENDEIIVLRPEVIAGWAMRVALSSL